jgi:biopolymer transport protein ExbB/TolQ
MRLYVLIAFTVVAGIFGWLGHVNPQATPVYLTQQDPADPEMTGTFVTVPVFLLIIGSVLAGVVLAAVFYAVPGFRERNEAAVKLQAQLKKARAQVRKLEQTVADREGQIAALREKAGLAEEESEEVDIELKGEAKAEEGAAPKKGEPEKAEAEEAPDEDEVEVADDEEPV